MDTNRIDREKAFHDKRFGEGDTERKKVDKFYTVNQRVTRRYIDIVSLYCKDKELLEYGCGPGSLSETWISLGASVTGIDISAEGIKAATEKFANMGKRASFYVMDAEKTDFSNNAFDIVVGTGIIHHLDLSRSCTELCRILKRNGHAVFVEPLGHNPLFNLYRTLTPGIRTVDEHPIRISDLDLFRLHFEEVNVEYYTLFTLLAVPFRKTALFSGFCGLLGKLDDFIFRISYLQRFAWIAIIRASNPRK